MAATRVRHLHSSSRFDRSPLSLLAFIKAFLGFVDVITLTEVGRNARVALLKKLPGWEFVQVEDKGRTGPPGRDECAVLVRSAKFRVLSARAVLLTGKATSDRGARRTYALHVKLQEVEALERLLVAVCHLPAHVEAGDNLRTGVDTEAWLVAVRNWGRILSKVQAGPFEVLAAADWNVDFRRKSHRQRVRAAMPELRSSWFYGGLPKKGTHGNRVIDDTRTTLKVRRIALRNPRGSSDHRAYVETLEFPKPKPTATPVEPEKPAVVNHTPTGRVVQNLRKRGIKVLERHQWGTRHEDVYQARRRLKSTIRPADTVVGHITVTRATGDHAADMRTLERIGMERFGSGVSYNWCLFQDGTVALGQPLDAKGTHTINDKHVPGFSFDQNLVARAIAWVAMPGEKLSPAAEHAYVQLVAAMQEEGEVTRDPDLVPHSLFAFKDCPTSTVRDKLPRILAAAKKA